MRLLVMKRLIRVLVMRVLLIQNQSPFVPSGIVMRMLVMRVMVMRLLVMRVLVMKLMRFNFCMDFNLDMEIVCPGTVPAPRLYGSLYCFTSL